MFLIIALKKSLKNVMLLPFFELFGQKHKFETWFGNFFRNPSIVVERVKVIMVRFQPPFGRIVYCPLNDTHKNKIKHQILMFHNID
jgi:hypothetical protein